jgi:hypothetical protein
MTFLKGKYSAVNKNKLLLSLRSLIILCGFILGSDTSLPAQETEINYRGFKADVSEIKDAPRQDTVLKALKRQIEIVEQVKPGEEDLKFFKSIPIVVIPPDSGTPGVNGSIKKTVFVKARDLASDRTILLHELLHAYHHLKIAYGFQNARIRAFYEEAKNKYSNLQNEYFLSNAREFFAVTASIYLFGDISRPPSKRGAIKKNQPEYYRYLEKVFGQHNSNSGTFR